MLGAQARGANYQRGNTMTAREQLRRTVGHEEIRPVPYTIGFEGDVAERLDVHCGGPAWRKRLTHCMVGTGVIA